MNVGFAPPRAALVWLGFYGAVLLAWACLLALVWADPAVGGLWGALCRNAAQAGFGTLAAMWALMAAAMMLPTFVPALQTYLSLSATGAADGRGAVALVAGYLTVWLGVAVLGAFAQGALARTGTVGLQGSGVSGWGAAGLLAAAGLYQFSAFKAACLAHCRMPLTFFIGRWRPGWPRAFRMGVELGALCLGCCWALMALALVGGAMNLAWMGAATLFMVLEKLPEIGRHISTPAGWGLVGAAVVQAGRAAGWI